MSDKENSFYYFMLLNTNKSNFLYAFLFHIEFFNESCWESPCMSVMQK